MTIKEVIIELIGEVLYADKDDDANIWLLFYLLNSLGMHPHNKAEALEMAQVLLIEKEVE